MNDIEDKYRSSNALMDEAILSLSSVQCNLKGLVEDLTLPFDNCNSITSDFTKLNESLSTLKTNIEYLASPFIEDKKKEMASALEELEAIRTKYKNLQKEWDNQQEHLGRLQGEMFKMRSQLKNQSSFCASLGAIMGSLLWKTSRLPSVVDVLLSTKFKFLLTKEKGAVLHLNSSYFIHPRLIILTSSVSQNRVSEFLCIVSGSLESFMETYQLTMPNVSTNEMQFILSLVGIVANMAATADGRQFLITDPNGKELIHQLLSMLPNIPDVSGDCLKRVVLMSLYNISINQLGLIMLLDTPALFQELTKNILGDTNPELRLLALRLLQSLTMQIPSAQAYHEITQVVPMDNIYTLTNTTDADMRLLAQSIVSNVQRAGAKYGSRPGTGEFSLAEYSKCHQSISAVKGNKSSCSVFNSVL